MRRSGGRGRQKGSAVIETALVLVPLLFMVITTLDLSRAVWTYHTLAMAVKSATRNAIVHGARCAEASTACPVSVADVVAGVQREAIGLDPANLQLTLTSGGQAVSCNPSGNCASNVSAWPAAPGNNVGQSVSIVGQYTFNSVLPFGLPQGRVNLTAKSAEMIEF